MGNTNFTGGSQPGIERSDAYPWGLKGINMPIPVEFAVKLRNNIDGLQDKYRKFITNRMYQTMPPFINRNEKIVYELLNAFQDKLFINLVKWNQSTNHNGSGNGDIRNLLEKKSPYKRLFDVHLLKELFYYPNILANMPDNKKEKIYKECEFPCFFTDMPEVVSIITNEAISENPSFNVNQLIEENNEGNFELFDKLLEEQDNALGMSDFYNSKSSLEKTTERQQLLELNLEKELKQFDRKERLIVAYEQACKDSYKNFKTLKQLIPGRNIINVSYRVSNSYQSGSHIITVIIDTIKKNCYILDSNGVSNCGINVFKYFKLKLGWKDDKYTLIPVMYHNENQTPKGFQHISTGGFCQTWNIFNQELVLLNDVGVDINKTIYDEILNFTDPILGDVKNKQVKITLILLEFMFYVYNICKPDYEEWIDRLNDKDWHYKNYLNSDEYYEEFNNLIEKQIVEMELSNKLISDEMMNLLENHVSNQLKKDFYYGIDRDIDLISDISYQLNSKTNKYISKIYPEYSESENLPISTFINNILNDI